MNRIRQATKGEGEEVGGGREQRDCMCVAGGAWEMRIEWKTEKADERTE